MARPPKNKGVEGAVPIAMASKASEGSKQIDVENFIKVRNSVSLHPLAPISLLQPARHPSICDLTTTLRRLTRHQPFPPSASTISRAWPRSTTFCLSQMLALHSARVIRTIASFSRPICNGIYYIPTCTLPSRWATIKSAGSWKSSHDSATVV